MRKITVTFDFYLTQAWNKIIIRTHFSTRDASENIDVIRIYKNLPFRHFASVDIAIISGNILRGGESLSQAEDKGKGARFYRTYLDRKGLLLPTACLECGLVFGCDSSLSLLAKEDLAATAPWAKSFLLGNALEDYSPLVVSSRNRGLLYASLTWPRTREWKWIQRLPRMTDTLYLICVHTYNIAEETFTLLNPFA